MGDLAQPWRLDRGLSTYANRLIRFQPSLAARLRDLLLPEQIVDVAGSGGVGDGRYEDLGCGGGEDGVALGFAVAVVDLSDRLPNGGNRDAVVAALRVERPEGYSFKNFGEVHFEGYANAKSIESYGHKSIEAVYPSTKDLMARPGSLSGSKFTDYHYNCL